MSTKIYEAYRLKDGVDLRSFATRARATTHAQVEARVRGLVLEVHASARANPEDARKVLALAEGDELARDPNVRVTVSTCWDYLKELFRVGGQLLERNPFDPRVQLWLYLLPEATLLVPAADGILASALEWLRTDPDLQDFAYGNNTDRPEDLSDEEWELRGTTWDRAFDQNEAAQLTLVISEALDFYRFDPTLDIIGDDPALKAEELAELDRSIAFHRTAEYKEAVERLPYRSRSEQASLKAAFEALAGPGLSGEAKRG